MNHSCKFNHELFKFNISQFVCAGMLDIYGTEENIDIITC